MSKTVFVTGGAGYVGSHCAKAFANAGWTVVTFDNLSRGHRDLVKWGDLIEGDILDRASLSAALEQVRPDAVAHFAAYAYVAESMTQPAVYYRNNVVGTMNLLDAMIKADVRQMVFSSSCATYGISDEIITEDTPQNPINPYGETKKICEKMIRDYGTAHDLRSVILRYFNAAGCDPDGETGERHDPEPHVIPLAIRGAMDGTFTFNILGGDYDTPDGTCVRDYIHVSDLADAHERALDYLSGGGVSEIFNLGTGQGSSVMQLADAVSKVAGKEVPRVIAERRPGDPPILVASAEKARDVLGWQPKRSDLESILTSAWDWFQREAKR
ncbi:MAG: UDP-glucose 4-epimerase GalE [Hyphomonas sp.]|nr:UDP-glucose 4-epimerase GalE [Alphaproteobacteria bacterium]MCR9225015.1 UDP-glucose 4-epimerase GalE [Hyphomonas sp.]